MEHSTNGGLVLRSSSLFRGHRHPTVARETSPLSSSSSSLSHPQASRHHNYQAPSTVSAARRVPLGPSRYGVNVTAAGTTHRGRTEKPNFPSTPLHPVQTAFGGGNIATTFSQSGRVSGGGSGGSFARGLVGGTPTSLGPTFVAFNSPSVGSNNVATVGARLGPPFRSSATSTPVSYPYHHRPAAAAGGFNNYYSPLSSVSSTSSYPHGNNNNNSNNNNTVSYGGGGGGYSDFSDEGYASAGGAAASGSSRSEEAVATSSLETASSGFGLGGRGAGGTAAEDAPLMGTEESALPVYSAFKVLDARNMRADYYGSCLSYGKQSLVTAIDKQVLLFDPNDLASYGATTLPLDFTLGGSEGEGDSGEENDDDDSTPLRTPTAVLMSHWSDSCAFIGDKEGGVCVVELVEGSTKLRIIAYSDGLRDPFSSSSSISSPTGGVNDYVLPPAAVNCFASSVLQPYVVYAGFSDGSVRVFDARQKGLLVGRAILPVPRAAVDALGRNATQCVVSIAINSTNGLLAVGTAHGTVQVYPIAGEGALFSSGSSSIHNHRDGLSLHERSGCVASSPTNVFGLCSKPTVEWSHADWSAAKALAFHPLDPNELSVGGGMGDGVIRTLDVHSGTVKAMVRTESQITQLVYSTSGAYLVSSHGFTTNITSNNNNKRRNLARQVATLTPAVTDTRSAGEEDEEENELSARQGYTYDLQLDPLLLAEPSTSASASTGLLDPSPSSLCSSLTLSSSFSSSSYLDEGLGVRSGVASPVELNPHETVRGEGGSSVGGGIEVDARGVEAPERASVAFTAESAPHAPRGRAALPLLTCARIPANSIAMWSRTPAQVGEENRLTSASAGRKESRSTRRSLSLSAAVGGGGSGGLGGGSSPLTEAGRAAMRRAHSSLALSSAVRTAEMALFNGESEGFHLTSLPSFEAITDQPQTFSWKKEVCLTQHTSRPLSLTKCRAMRGPDSGVFATAAGDSDSSIRLWRLISPPPLIGPTVGVGGRAQRARHGTRPDSDPYCLTLASTSSLTMIGPDRRGHFDDFYPNPSPCLSPLSQRLTTLSPTEETRKKSLLSRSISFSDLGNAPSLR